MTVVGITKTQQNAHYDPERCHNGGGYDQPLTTISFDNGWTLVIDDTSCGELGDRVHCVLYGRSGRVLRTCGIDTVDRTPDEYSDLRPGDEWLSRIIYDLTGLWFAPAC